MKTETGRVLHLIDTTGPGGAETVFLQVAAGLVTRGWNSRMVVLGAGWVLDRVHELELPVDVVETRGHLDRRYLMALRSIVRRHRIQLIHAHLFSPAVYASAVGLMTGTPVIATFHGVSDITAAGIGGYLRYLLLGRATRLVCVSESLRNELLARQPVPEGRVSLIHNGVDMAVFGAANGSAVRDELGVSDDELLVGALGNVRAAKDYGTFLRAAAELSGEERFRFVIAGERTDPLYSELVALRDRLGLERVVRFLGFRNDVPELVAAFDILVVSSNSEGFSLAAIQAMAAGTPVVATRSGGPQGIITDGRDGLLVPIESPADLAAAVRLLAEDSALALRISTNAQEKVQQEFSLEAMLDGYEAVYQAVI